MGNKTSCKFKIAAKHKIVFTVNGINDHKLYKLTEPEELHLQMSRDRLKPYSMVFYTSVTYKTTASLLKKKKITQLRNSLTSFAS